MLACILHLQLHACMRQVVIPIDAAALLNSCGRDHTSQLVCISFSVYIYIKRSSAPEMEGIKEY
jgi:hypothetical protein